MLFVVAIALAIWFAMAALGMPRVWRWAVLGGVLYPAILLLVSVTPPGARIVPGTLQVWLLSGGLVALVLAYRWGLGRVKARVAQREPAPARANAFSDAELDRYSRHIVLREIGGPGQRKLQAARVLVVGAGGLGAPALQYLAAAGVGTIGVIDDDIVSNSNLQRQVIHTDAMIGKPKVQSAAVALNALNPHVTIRPYQRRFTPEIATDLLADYDLVLDGTDNFATRYAVNAACVAAGVPLISGALSQWEGQLSVFDPAHGAPCYRCIFPQAPADGLAPSCAEGGVLGPLPGVIGTMMAVEAIKAITGAGEGLRGRLLIYDALFADQRIIAIHPRATCETCGGGAHAKDDAPHSAPDEGDLR